MSGPNERPGPWTADQAAGLRPGGRVTVGPPSGYDQLRLAVSIVAALVLAAAGYLLVSIRSVGGDTIFEAGFQGMGVMAWGFAVLAIAVGLRRT